MEKETKLKLWEDYLDFTEKYQNEKPNELAGALMIFVLKMSFDMAPSKEQVLNLNGHCLERAWEWHVEDKEKEND